MLKLTRKTNQVVNIRGESLDDVLEVSLYKTFPGEAVTIAMAPRGSDKAPIHRDIEIGESLCISEDPEITVSLLGTSGKGSARLGFKAPMEVKILRAEIDNEANA